MKGIGKFSITALLAVFLLSFGTSSAFAAYGYGDTFEDPMELWNPYASSTNSVSLPIDSPYDNDWYVVNNSYGYQDVSFAMLLYPPSGIDLTMQLVRTDANNNITSTSYFNNGGPGEMEAVGTGVEPGNKVYFRVISTGANDYDSYRPYTLNFEKFN